MRPSDGRYSLWPLAVIGFVTVLAVASTTLVMRLNQTPPADFIALKTGAKGGDASRAAAYWDTAVQAIQWRYPRTSPLPEQPPAEFSLADSTEKGKSAEEQTTRRMYWAKLREEWMKSDNWHRTVDFDMSWITNTARSVWRGVDDFITDHL